MNLDLADVVVLDWTGGTSPIYPNHRLRPMDLSVFETADGKTLGTDAALLKERVRTRVAEIFCEWAQIEVIVINAERNRRADTVVHLTQAVQPGGGMDIGEAEYDPCNNQDDNSAIIFGERLVQLGGAYTFDEWVAVISNVTAHEIGHTLGYNHVRRDDQSIANRALFAELMLDRHSMSEMRRPQRFIIDQTNCPDRLAAKSVYSEQGIATCAAVEHSETD